MRSWEELKINVRIDSNNDNNENNTNDVVEIITKCPKCNTKNKNQQTLYVHLLETTWFCKHCGFAGDLLNGVASIEKRNKADIWKYNYFIKNYKSNILNSKIVDRFQEKKISLSLLEKYHISQSKTYFPITQSELPSIVFPYFKDEKLVNLVYFTANHRHSEIGGVEICYGYDDILEEHTYIVADEFEKLSLNEVGLNNSISLFGGLDYKDVHEYIKNLDFLTNIESKLNKVKKITIAMPNTEAGQVLTEELLRRLGRERCWLITPPEQNYDWNKILVDYGSNQLKLLLESATPVPVSGIFDIDDVESELDDLYHYGLKKGAETGFKSLNENYTVVPGQWTVVTGIPGHGKSNFLDALVVNLAMKHEWKFAFFSPENQPIHRHFANILEKYLDAPFTYGLSTRITEEQKEHGKIWLKKHFSVILPDEDASWSIDGILELAKVLVYRKGIKGLIIDPWNELDHTRPGNFSETEYISSMLTKIRQFARNFNVHVWLVAHPAKLYKDKEGKYPVPTPYDIAGSAHFRNKADNAITVWRNVGGKDQDVADIHIQKIRFKEVGKVGMVSLRYNEISGRFIDDIDQNKRRRSLEEGSELETSQLKKY